MLDWIRDFVIDEDARSLLTSMLERRFEEIRQQTEERARLEAELTAQKAAAQEVIALLERRAQTARREALEAAARLLRTTATHGETALATASGRVERDCIIRSEASVAAYRQAAADIEALIDAEPRARDPT